jgi:hypothetical protein
MFLKEFNQKGVKKIAKVNKMLKEEFGVSLKTAGFPKKAKLDSLLETANASINKIKSVNTKFQQELEYAKFLGIKDVVQTMINEGMYAESPAHGEMKEMINASVCNLMDSGYTMDEACGECMNQYRMDSRFAYDDEHVMPIILSAAKSYVESCGMKHESIEEEGEYIPETDLNDSLLRELAKECGVELSGTESLEAIEEKLESFAKVTEKSRDAVVGFLNGLEEDAVGNGIKMFGAKVAEQNKFTGARKDAIAKGEKKFTVDGEEYDVTGDAKDEKKNEGTMFDSLVDDMINEEVEGTSIEEAEVVMAVRALADDIQGHVEEIGRMTNESLPAIADQMRGEMGAQAAATFADSVQGLLGTYIASSKAAKDGIDNAIAGLIGAGTVVNSDDMGLGDTGELGVEAPAEVGIEEPAMDVNEPAAAGPEEEPLGRAPLEV